MPRNFLEGCEAIEYLCDDVAGLTPEALDIAITESSITPDSEAEDLKYLQEKTGIDSLAAVEAAETAEKCQVCKNLTLCKIGSFLSSKL